PMTEQHSMCPHCKHQLSFLDLFPILSYLWLRGRCRYCQKKISAQYFGIELVTALLFAAFSYLLWQRSWDHLLLAPDNPSFYWVGIAAVVTGTSLVLLISLCIYDLRWGILANQWTLGGSLFLFLATILAVISDQPLLWQPMNPAGTDQALVSTLLSGVIAALFFLAVAYGSEILLRKPGMGMGDVKLALFLGFFLGFPGIIVGLYLAFIFGAVLSLLLIAGKRKKIGNSIPFGPFMVGGALLAAWLTPEI